jgi:hypothetical protein
MLKKLVKKQIRETKRRNLVGDPVSDDPVSDDPVSDLVSNSVSNPVSNPVSMPHRDRP